MSACRTSCRYRRKRGCRMKAMVIGEFDGPEVLRWIDQDMPLREAATVHRLMAENASVGKFARDGICCQRRRTVPKMNQRYRCRAMPDVPLSELGHCLVSYD